MHLPNTDYNELVQPSINNPITLYSNVEEIYINKIVHEIYVPTTVGIMKEFFFGKLTADALPHHWYTIGGTVFIVLTLIAIAMMSYENKALGMALA